MNPELDERIILTISSSFVEISIDWLKITAVREAHGMNVNEGLCYEVCSGIPFSGKVSGELFFAMDGYTRLLLLPYIVHNLEMNDPQKEMVETAMNSFVKKLSDEFSLELADIANIEMQEPRNLNHKLIPLPQESYRKYAIIFFLRDDDKKKYLGRIYLHLVLEKE
ncbi:MAG: chemotaxis protein CheX [Spirochaetia bacterium]|nr:chemotaxis protein CheX [Spirochaetia bacterium]